MEEQVDVVVLGLGPGGENAAGALAEAGLSVVGIDDGLVGGECPYWGCVPSKMMIRAADALAEARRVPELAGTVSVTPDWSIVAARVREGTDGWDDRVAVQRLESKGARVVKAAGRLDGPGRVTVGDTTFVAARGVVVATGGEPSVPPIPGLDRTPYWTNHPFIETPELPASLVVIGGGAIGVELAQMSARFGVPVTVIEVAPRLLAAEEPESCELLAEVFEHEGLDVRTGVTIGSVSHDGAAFTVTLGAGEAGDGREAVRADRLLVATGRHSDLGAIGVASVGLDPGARTIPTDGHCRVPGTAELWALGDVTGHGAFTHMSMYQSAIVIDDILGRPHHEAEYHAVPRVTFTDPEIGAVGMTEQQARQAGLDVAVGRARIPESARGWIHKVGNEGFVKLVADRAHGGVLVGATSAGPTGGEVLSMLTLAVHARHPAAMLRRMIYAYPTFHRAVEDALRDLDADLARTS